MKKEKMKLTWYSYDEVFEKASKKPAFRRAYNEQLARAEIAAQIRSLRSKKRFTQKYMATKTGMPQSVIARIESGEKGITVDTLGRIASALGKEVKLV